VVSEKISESKTSAGTETRRDGATTNSGVEVTG